ncbi:MAG TPA: hypothetical protein ENH13_05270, partial [Euryarchaeota archaeon]|nr:hypothetical protein [Euryarchaeota archaeon]
MAMSDRASMIILIIGFVSGILLLGGMLQATGTLDITHPLGAKLMYAGYPAPTPAPLDVNVVFSKISKNPNFCFNCHDAEQTKSFHIPRQIIKIDEGKGLRRRICVDCHGPEGNNATRQMSGASMIKPQEDGTFRLENIIPHSIHSKKLKLGAMTCQTCHLTSEGNLEIPVADASQGQVLVCEKCHIPVNRGNYIAIHVEYGSKSCLTCHTGDVIGIHKEATSMLGSASKR